MKFSLLPSDFVRTVDTEFASASELAALITAHNYSGGVFKNNYTNNENFLSTELLILDYDNYPDDPQLSLADAIKTFSAYRCIIAPTRNHQKPKQRGERTLPAADRFRVVLFLSRPITGQDEFRSTWQSINDRFPGCDQACKDPARRLYASTSIAHVSETGLLVEPVQGAAKPTPKRQAVAEGVKGKLSRTTLEFLAMGAPAGKWNDSLFKAAKNAYEQGYGEDEFTEMAEKIHGYLEESSLKTIRSGFSNDPLLPVSGNQALVDYVRRATVFTNMADMNEIAVVDLKTGDLRDISINAIAKVLGKEEFVNYGHTNTRLVSFEYNPRGAGPTRADADGFEFYNTYCPPRWLRAHYYGGGRPTPVSELPQVYADFFHHLTNDDHASFDYLLDWLAVSLQGRNLTMLTAIGEQGIGKGTLGHIMELLHGERNFAKVRDQVFKAQFNGPLADKTLVYVDEVDLRTKEARDRMKDVVNNVIEIERKGKDPIQVRNHASFYLSSNHMDAVRLEPGDRRFSIIQLTDKKLTETPLIGRIDDILGEDGIARLAAYLLGRQPVNNMLKPFISARTEEVIEAGLADWEEYFIQEWAPEHQGESLTLKELRRLIDLEVGGRARPGRGRVQAMCAKSKGALTWHRDKAGKCTVRAGVSFELTPEKSAKAADFKAKQLPN